MLKRLISRFIPRKSGDAAALALPMPEIEIDQEQRYRPIEWSLVKRMLGALKPFKWQYILGISIGLLHVLLDQQGPRFLRSIINSSTQKQVLITITFWACAFTSSVILQRWTILIITRAGESVQFDFRRRLFDHLQRLSMSYYDKT